MKIKALFYIPVCYCLLLLNSAYASMPGSGSCWKSLTNYQPQAKVESKQPEAKSSDTGQSSAEYDIEVTKPKGRSIDIKIELADGQSINTQAIIVQELERRINIPLEVGTSIDLAKKLVWKFNKEQQTTINHLIRDDLKAEWNGSFYLSPLSSELEEFHESFVAMDNFSQAKKSVKKWNIGEKKSGALNTLVSAGSVEVKPLAIVPDGSWNTNSSRNYIDLKYWLGWQNELSLYYDTSDFLFEQNGIAVRLKAWYKKDDKFPNLESDVSHSELKRAQRWSLTIKKDVQAAINFTNRIEHHVSLPEAIKIEDLPFIIPQVVKQLELIDLENNSVSIVRRIETERVSLNIKNSNKEKIGFMTLDHFNRYVYNDGKYTLEGFRSQFEAEILPEFIDDYRSGNLEGLDKLIDNVRETLTGHEEVRPKYLQPLDAE